MKGFFQSFNANEEDIVYTPDRVAEGVVKRFNPTGRVLDPCKGGGAFLKYLPKNSQWCEIREGVDFFEWKSPVDWIVSNPPYSIFKDFLSHSFTIAPNIVYLVPIIKVFNSLSILQQISTWGGISTCYVMGLGKEMDFPQSGYPISALYFQKGYTGGMKIEFWKQLKGKI